MSEPDLPRPATRGTTQGWLFGCLCALVLAGLSYCLGVAKGNSGRLADESAAVGGDLTFGLRDSAGDSARPVFHGAEHWSTRGSGNVSDMLHQGKRAQWIKSPDQPAILQGVHFGVGRMEFDLASTSPENPPWLHFGIGSEGPAKLTLHPKPRMALPDGPDLYRLVITKNETTSLVAIYRQEQLRHAAGTWTHVSLEATADQCRVFVNRNETPLVVTGKLFEAGGFGIRGDGYIANIQLQAG